MNIGAAVEALKQDKRVARSGWNGKKMWLRLVKHNGAVVRTVDADAGTPYDMLDFVEMKTADDKLVPWLCNQTDLLAEDWEIVT